MILLDLAGIADGNSSGHYFVARPAKSAVFAGCASPAASPPRQFQQTLLGRPAATRPAQKA
jgi:hypothetical protein